MKEKAVKHLIESSFLYGFISEGWTIFDYTLGHLYLENEKEIVKSTIEPNNEEFEKFIQRIAEIHGNEHNSKNPHLLIKTSNYKIVSTIDMISGVYSIHLNFEKLF